MKNGSRTCFVVAMIAAGLMTASLTATAEAKTFSTPNGNISCLMRNSYVRCDIVKRGYEPPPQPASCDYDWGSSLGVNDRGRSRFLCVSDAVGPGRRVLGPGESLRLGPFSCRSRSGRILCLYGNSNGFLLSRSRYEVF